MNEMESVSNLPTREQIKRLQLEMSKYPQAEFETKHYFADGMYCRELPTVENTLVIGKVHKKEHFFMLIQGEITVWTENGMKHVVAPFILVSKPGTKRAILSHVKSTYITVHRTDKTDLDEIEKELVDDDPDSMYLTRNIRKFPELEKI